MQAEQGKGRVCLCRQTQKLITSHPEWAPHRFANPQGPSHCLGHRTPPPPPAHLIHLGLGLLQSPVTGEVWRGRRGAPLPSRGGRGGGGSGSRPEGQGRIKTRSLEPPAPRPGLRPSSGPSIRPSLSPSPEEGHPMGALDSVRPRYRLAA